MYSNDSLCLFFLNVGLNTHVHSQHQDKEVFDVDYMSGHWKINFVCRVFFMRAIPVCHSDSLGLVNCVAGESRY